MGTMMLSHTDELLVNEVAKAILLDGAYTISRTTGTQANAISSTIGIRNGRGINNNNNDYWTTYFLRNIPYDTTSSVHKVIMNEIQLRRLSHLVSVVDSPSDVSIQPSDDDILQMAYVKVKHPWLTIPDEYNRFFEYFREKITVEGSDPNVKATQKITSTSLFSLTSSSTSLLNSFITLDIIKERTGNNLSDMISMLKDVTYLEDLVPDKDDVCALLRNELVSQVMSNNANAPGRADTTDDNPNGCSSLGQSIIDLHRHWFHRTRKGVLQASTSHDYRMIQTELLYNLIQVLQMVDSKQQQRQLPTSSGVDDVGTISLELYQSCMATSLDMFADWMDRNVYQQNDATMKEIGKALWKWSIVDIPSTSSKIDKRRMIYHHDPFGHWMCQYITQRYMTRTELMELLSQPPPISNIHSENTVIHLYNVATNCSKNLISCDLSKQNDDLGTYIWILSVFRSILLSTRVSHFPWNLLSPTSDSSRITDSDDTIDTNTTAFATLRSPPDHSIQRMFELYHQLLCDSQMCIDDSSSLNIETVGSICIDSIEILISGTQRNECSKVHSLMIQEMHSLMCIHVAEKTKHNERKSSGHIATMIQNMTHRFRLGGIATK